MKKLKKSNEKLLKIYDLIEKKHLIFS